MFKTAVIDLELTRLQIIALQENQVPGSGSVRERNSTSLWQGKLPGKTRERGVGLSGQEQLAGNHYSTYKRNQANPTASDPLISGTGQPNQCLCANPDFSGRSKGPVLTLAQSSVESQKQSHWMNENEGCLLEIFFFTPWSLCWGVMLKSVFVTQSLLEAPSV